MDWVCSLSLSCVTCDSRQGNLRIIHGVEKQWDWGKSPLDMSRLKSTLELCHEWACKRWVATQNRNSNSYNLNASVFYIKSRMRQVVANKYFDAFLWRTLELLSIWIGIMIKLDDRPYVFPDTLQRFPLLLSCCMAPTITAQARFATCWCHSFRSKLKPYDVACCNRGTYFFICRSCHWVFVKGLKWMLSTSIGLGGGVGLEHEG